MWQQRDIGDLCDAAAGRTDGMRTSAGVRRLSPGRGVLFLRAGPGRRKVRLLASSLLSRSLSPLGHFTFQAPGDPLFTGKMRERVVP